MAFKVFFMLCHYVNFDSSVSVISMFKPQLGKLKSAYLM